LPSDIKAVSAFDVVGPGTPPGQIDKSTMKIPSLVFIVLGAGLTFSCESTIVTQTGNAATIHMNCLMQRLHSYEHYRPQRCTQQSGISLRLRGGSSATSNFEEVGSAFVQHYYNIFDTNRAGLQNLYQEMSMMTFEGEKIQGSQAITQKLVSLPFQSVKHEIVTVDSQPSASGGVLVFVCGNLKVSLYRQFSRQRKTEALCSGGRI
jgi:hypothetical protein